MGVSLSCQSSAAVVFTVSCRDEFGNKCLDVGGNYYIRVEVHEGNERNGKEVSLSSSEWRDSSSGVFPCVLQAPGVQLGYYWGDSLM